MAKAPYTVQPAIEWGAGRGPNGTGKRAKVAGWYVVSSEGRKVRAFNAAYKGENEAAAIAWADELTRREA